MVSCCKVGSQVAGGEPEGLWVEPHFRNNENGSSTPASVSIYDGDVQKVLLNSQHQSGRSSPKS